MNYIQYFLLLAATPAWSVAMPDLPPSSAASAICIPLLPRSAADQVTLIENAGAYCIERDFRQPVLYGAGHHGPRYDHALVRVGGGEVTIDLKRHTLHTDARSHGLLSSARFNVGAARDEKREFGTSTRNVTVRNGTIDLRGIGTGVRFFRWWNLIMLNEKTPSEATPYEKTRYVLDNLTIKTDNVGIQLEGDGNIVRNCIIESDGDAAIIMAGPNAKILNNTIVLGNPLIPTWTRSSELGSWLGMAIKAPAARKQTRAAIVLQDGSGSVIRGNRIEVNGKSATRHSIYLNNGSRDVLVEGNTFVNGVDPVVQLNGSSVRVARNVSVQ